jgi:hypothetical protein
MKPILFCALFTLFSINAQAIESSECDGKSTWQKINTNSQDISVRKCDVFGMAFLEVKSQLAEARCINIANTQTNTVWKHFYLHKDSIKALGAVNTTTPLSELKVTSNKTKNNRCDIS